MSPLSLEAENQQLRQQLAAMQARVSAQPSAPPLLPPGLDPRLSGPAFGPGPSRNLPSLPPPPPTTSSSRSPPPSGLPPPQGEPFPPPLPPSPDVHSTPAQDHLPTPPPPPPPLSGSSTETGMAEGEPVEPEPVGSSAPPAPRTAPLGINISSALLLAKPRKKRKTVTQTEEAKQYRARCADAGRKSAKDYYRRNPAAPLPSGDAVIENPGGQHGRKRFNIRHHLHMSKDDWNDSMSKVKDIARGAGFDPNLPLEEQNIQYFGLALHRINNNEDLKMTPIPRCENDWATKGILNTWVTNRAARAVRRAKAKASGGGASSSSSDDE